MKVLAYITDRAVMTNTVLLASLLMALLYPDTSMRRIDMVTQIARRRMTNEFRRFVEEKRVDSKTYLILREEAYGLLESGLEMYLHLKRANPENKEYKRFMEMVHNIIRMGPARVDLSNPRVRKILLLLIELLDSVPGQQ